MYEMQNQLWPASDWLEYDFLQESTWQDIVYVVKYRNYYYFVCTYHGVV